VNSNVWVIAFAAAFSVGTPLVLAGLGELLAERSGVLNLGVEGMMLVGAVTAFIAADIWGNPWIAMLVAMPAAGCLALVHGLLSISMRANQIVSGLALVIFGTGLARFVGQSVEGTVRGAEFNPIDMGALSDIPFLGPVLFSHDPIVYASWACVALVAFYISRTRPGLGLRAVGESPATADSQGLAVARTRYLHVIAGGLLAGAAGGYQALVRVPSWSQEATTNGIGWIALALVVFASWKPGRLLVGAVIFGFALRSNFTLQAAGITEIPAEFLAMLPYVLTLLVLVVVSSPERRRRTGSPAALGVPYVRDER
jgi:ABC-type uncharacterized transport system permease subunit